MAAPVPASNPSGRRRSHVLGFTAGVLALAAAMSAAEDPQALMEERRQVQERFPAAFAAIDDIAGQPRVLLIGDSISIGYTPHVRELLAGVANVHRIPENGGATTRGLQQLDSWLGEKPWDVIHFNFGLHDIARRDHVKPIVSAADYEHNLRLLVARLQATGARVIFATTTPVPASVDGPMRETADVPAYNAIARRVMQGLGVPVNDLYEFILPDVGKFQRSHNVHFTDAGYQRLAQPVAAAIRGALPAH